MLKAKQFYDSQGKGSAARYFTEHLSPEGGRAPSDYYLEGKGVLRGGTFAHMGLKSRDVDLQVFKALESNKHPETGARITQRTNKTQIRYGIDRITGERIVKDVANRKSGMDVTLAASKTISMAIVENDNEFGRSIERVCVQAASKAMTFAETLARVSVSGRGAFNERYTGNLLYLSVVHRTARATSQSKVPDMYWHSHHYAFPMSYDPESKRMMAVSMSHVLKFSETIDAIFVSELDRGLTELGIGTTRSADNKSLEITSVKGKEVFSKRTSEINTQTKREATLVDTVARFKVKEAAVRGHHLDFEKARQEVRNGRSRAADVVKRKRPIEQDELLAAWRAQMSTSIRASLTPEAILAGERRNWLSVAEAKETVLHEVFRQESVCHEYDIVAAMLRATGGTMSFDEALNFARSSAFIKLDNQGHVTTQAVRDEERRMLEHARASWDTRKPLISSATRPIKDERVRESRDQAAAVRFIWDSQDGVMDISGIAGSGKSSLLREAIPAIKEEGHQVILLAPTSASEKNLKADFPEAQTLQKFLADMEIMPGAADGFVICVDESSLVSVPQMAKLVELVHSHGCRLVLLGDVDQHSSVERGDALRILQGSKSVRSSELTETYRAQVAYLKETVLDLKAGGIGCEIGFNRLDEAGDIRELEDVDAMREAAVQAHLESSRKGELSIMAAPTHVECRAASEQVRNILKAEGRIAAEDHQVSRLIDLSVEGPSKRDPLHYAPGRIIIFYSRTKPGFNQGEKWKVIARVADGRFAVQRGAEVKLFDPKSKGRWKIYETEEMSLAVGDQVRITSGFQENKVAFKNNDISKVMAIDSEKITLSDGRSMSANFVHLDQGVCTTSYSTQCRTVDRITVLAPCAALGAMDARCFYVLASRARHQAVFFTDCAEALKECVLREGDRACVWDYEKDLVGPGEARPGGARHDRARCGETRHSETRHGDGRSSDKVNGYPIDLQPGKRLTKVSRILPPIPPAKMLGQFQKLVAGEMMKMTHKQQEREQQYVDR
jgi:conjugative relaxase-like TrwC/TraI family protein